MVNLVAIILFLIGISIVLILSLAGKIHLSLLFLIPLLPLQNVIERFHQLPFGKDFVDIILIAMIIGWMSWALVNKEKLFQPTPFNKLLFVMIVFTYISLWKGSSYLGFPLPIYTADVRVQTWKNYMILPLLFFLVVNNIRDKKQIKWLVLFMILSMVLMNFYTLRQIKWMPGLLSRVKIRGTFVWLGPNELAAFYAIYTFVLFGVFLFDKAKLRRIFYGSLIILNLYCTLFLYSRGAYLAVAVGLLALSLMKKKIIFIIPLLFLLMFWQTILPARVIERINQTQTEEGILDISSQHRLELWEESMDLFKEKPIMGVGFAVIPFLGLTGGLHDTHNIYIKILAEQGIIGLIIFLFLFWLALKSGWQLYKTADDTFLKGLGLGFAACVIATMAANFFGDRWTYLQLGAYYWVFLGLVARGNLIVQEQQLEIKES